MEIFLLCIACLGVRGRVRVRVRVRVGVSTWRGSYSASPG